MDICDKDKCTGCGACQNVCPKKCINIVIDNEGFYKYNINFDFCIKCKLCRKVCPSNGYKDPIEKKRPLGYLCWNLNNNVRLQSSSGGIFSILAEEVIDNKGEVWGAAFDGDFNLNHVRINCKKELPKLRGSKYIQSYTGYTFKETKEALTNGKYVLYSGTPCQIAGLYKFLEKDYDKLVTCDLICHGVCSTKVFKDILDYYENRYKSKIVDIKYRDKKKGWSNSSVKIKFDSGKELSEVRNISMLAYGFAAGFTNNKICGMCEHATIPRRADFTLGDYGAKDYRSYGNKNINDGISVLLINSSKGFNFFQLIKNKMYFEEKKIGFLLENQKNIAESNRLHPKRAKFFKDFESKPFKEIKNKYLIAPIKNKLIYKIGKERYNDARAIIKKIVFEILGRNR